MAGITDILQGLFGAGASSYLAKQDFDRIETLGDNLQSGFGTLATAARDNAKFTPYSITGTTGTMSTTAQGDDFGGATFGLNPTQQARMDDIQTKYTNYINNYQSAGGPALGNGGFTGPALAGSLPGQWQTGKYGASLPGQPGYQTLGGGNLAGARESMPGMAGLYNATQAGQQFTQGQAAAGLQGSLGPAGQQMINNLGIGTGRSEADIYGMLEGMQQPDRERERLALRDELYSQGRLGTQTAQYGGTPEELARAKAVEEARSANAFRAFQLAGEEQGRLANQRLNAYQIGEQAAGRQDRGLLESFGLADRAAGTAANLTNILGSLGLQGRDIGNRFNLGLLDAGVQQRGQDVTAGLGQLGEANRFNLGIYDTASRNALENERVKALGDELGIRASDVYGSQLLNQYGTDMQGAIAKGQQAVQADANRVGMFDAQVRQNIGEAANANDAYRNSFIPQEMLMKEMGLANDIFEIQQRTGIEGERFAQNAEINALENQFNLETLLANSKSDQNQMITNMLLGAYNKNGERVTGGLFEGAFDWLGKSITDLFGIGGGN